MLPRGEATKVKYQIYLGPVPEGMPMIFEPKENIDLLDGLELVLVMNLYSAFSMWIYSNALYNTLWGTLPDCFMAQFTIFLM